MLDNPRLREKYRIEGLIGNGSFSVVYRATEVRCDRRVAIKALQQDVYDGESYQYALSEISAMGRLWQHPNIVSVHTVEPGDEKFVAYIVMEYVDGGSLRRRMQRGALPLSEALGLAYDVCSGLAYAHRRNVVHRDVKPRNILVTGDGIARVSDFGVAQVREVRHDYASTCAGTRRYMAPEQYEEVYDHRVDVFAAGLLLWEMALGTFPYRGRTQDDIQRSKRRRVEPPASLPEPVREILDVSLRTEPVERFRTMDEMRDAIERILMSRYEQVVSARLSEGLSLQALDVSFEPYRHLLRVSGPAARCIEARARDVLEQTERSREAARTKEQVKSAATAIMEHVSHQRFEDAEEALTDLMNTGAVPPPVMELVEMLCRTLHVPTQLGQTEIAASKPPTRSRALVNLRMTDDDEETALSWREVGHEHESGNRWRRARSAYRRSQKLFAQRASKLRRQGELETAARLFQKAGESAALARDIRRAQTMYSYAAACWLEGAERFEAASARELAAEAYRAAARAYEQANDHSMARKHYRAAATRLYEAAKMAYDEGSLDDATRLCRLALELCASAQGWTLADAARQLLVRIRNGGS